MGRREFFSWAFGMPWNQRVAQMLGIWIYHGVGELPPHCKMEAVVVERFEEGSGATAPVRNHQATARN